MRLGDVARVELGAQDYALRGLLDNKERRRAAVLPVAGLQRAPAVEGHSLDDGGAEQGFPGGHEVRNHLRHV